MEGLTQAKKEAMAGAPLIEPRTIDYNCCSSENAARRKAAEDAAAAKAAADAATSAAAATAERREVLCTIASNSACHTPHLTSSSSHRR